MRPFSTFFLLFSLFLLILVVDGRKDPEGYWKREMHGVPMPKAIADILHGGSAAGGGGSTFTRDQIKKGVSLKKVKFVRDFDVKPNVIIYHSHVDVYPKRDINGDHFIP